MGAPKVAVVILNWNGKNHLERFLPSVLDSAYPNLEIVVGDNASNDGSVEWLRENHSGITLLQNDKNYGFAGGYNKILERVQADYYVLLNSDVEVSSNWIAPIIDLMESDAKIAACQPHLMDFNKRDFFEYSGAAGGFMDKFGYLFCRGRIFESIEENKGQYNDAKAVFWACGAALFIKSSCWKEVKGLDENLFAHMEEVDLCWRLQHLGYKIMCCPQSQVYHVGGATLSNTSPFKTYLNFRNNLIILHKNLPQQRLFSTIFIRLWLDLAAWIKFLFSGKFKHSLAISKAHIHYFWGIGKWQKQRKCIHPSDFPATVYPKSIVWQYFVNKKRKYSEL